jgi:hypothetical protein
MSMPSKGSRAIRLGGHDYRWRVRRRPTYSQANAWGPMSVSIQSCTEGARSVLVVSLRVSRPDSWLAPHQTGLTPDIVRDIIERAVAAGWDPLGTRSPVAFEYGLIKDTVGR